MTRLPWREGLLALALVSLLALTVNQTSYALFSDTADATDNVFAASGARSRLVLACDEGGFCSDVRIAGRAAGAHTGIATARGDFDGDAHEDLAIAAASTRHQGDGAVEVYVLLGPIANGTLDLSATSADVEVTGVREGALKHAPLAVDLADVNGDGRDDLLVGGPRTSTGGGARDAGAVHVVFGRPVAAPLVVDLDETPADVTILGPARDARLGAAVHHADLDHDNVDEIVIGAPGGDGGLRLHEGTDRKGAKHADGAGEVFLLRGRASWPALIDLGSETPDGHVVGATAGSLFGYSVHLGDATGDGVPDLVAGAPGEADLVGTAFVVPGTVLLAGGTYALSAGLQHTELPGALMNEAHGYAVRVCDATGDAIGDVLVGAPFAPGAAGASEAGEVRFYEGGLVLPTAPGYRVHGAGTGDRLGATLGCANLNLNAARDLLLGAVHQDTPGTTETDAGAFHVILGRDRFDGSLDLALSRALVAVHGEDAGDMLGFGLGAVDADGDGQDEAVACALHADGVGDVSDSAGECHLFTYATLRG